MNYLLLVFAAMLSGLVAPQADAFVYLGPTRPRLKPADGKTVVFRLTRDVPQFVDKETFADGSLSEVADSDVFQILVTEAMRLWNDVPGLPIQLTVDTALVGAIDPDDDVFTIGLGEIRTLASGLAFPVEDAADPTTIRDCDIQVARDVVSIPSFIYVMVHELGHCLGLGHNHSDPQAIMGYWQPENEIALGLDDMAGVLSLYSPSGGEPINSVAPCGSVAIRKNVPSSDEGQRRLGLAVFSLMLVPVVCVVTFDALRTLSFRRRRRRSGR